MPAEISKLKPDLEAEIPVPKITYLSATAEYDSYEKEGFEPPQEHERRDYFERRFPFASGHYERKDKREDKNYDSYKAYRLRDR